MNVGFMVVSLEEFHHDAISPQDSHNDNSMKDLKVLDDTETFIFTIESRFFHCLT